VQRRRAENAVATGRRILDAAVTTFVATGDEPTLEAVAAHAGVTVQTVLRRFGSKGGLFEAAAAAGTARVAEERGVVAVGDVAGAVRNLLDHYERWGDVALALLAAETRRPALAAATAGGRRVHREWVERVFAPWLDALPGSERPRRLAQLVAVTDVYVWKLLHRDLGLPRAEVDATLLDLLDHLRSPVPSRGGEDPSPRTPPHA
jgi:AcrR family transcriptional regulator